MPLIPLKISPGVYTESTDKDAEPRWKDSNRIRFRKNYPENIGGWIPDNADTIKGVCRGINNWVTLSDDVLIGLGTHKRLYIWRGGTFSNITPLRDSTSAPFSSSQLNAPFTSTASSDLISVAHTSHGVTACDEVVFSNASASPIDGTVVDGAFDVISVTDSNNFVIQISAAVTTSEASWGGATVDYDYEINVGEESTVPALGWGSQTWGESGTTWGTPRSTSAEIILARTWALDQWGEDLIASIKGGATYTWDATNGLTTRAVIITNAPATTRFSLVSSQGRHLIEFGAHDGSVDDPLFIRFSSSEDFTDFTPTSTNSAGDLRLDRGTEIVGAIRTRGQILVLTDVSAHSMFSTNDTLVFGIEIVGEGCGMAGPHAAAEHAGIVSYTGIDNFYIYDGVIRVMDCDVWSHVFEDINLEQKIKFHTFTVTAFNEYWYLYCSASSIEIDKYAKYNWISKVWDVGDLDRTAWVDIGQGGGLTKPYATDASGVLYQHETGVNDGVSGALGSYIESYDFDLPTDGEEGGVLYKIKKMLPDFKVLVGSVDITLKAKKYPHSTAVEKTYTVTSSTERFNPKIKGRQIAMRIESDAVDDEWRAGTMSAQIVPHGRR